VRGERKKEEGEAEKERKKDSIKRRKFSRNAGYENVKI
jgi:hypothetical protein